MKTSRWKRRDKGSGLWISSNKRIYFYWFRFLQHAAEDPNRVVDWSLYESWGGKDVILNTKFDAWWNKRWKTLFGYKEGETTPLYPLSKAPSGKRTRPQPEGIRFALRVYELKDKPLLNEMRIRLVASLEISGKSQNILRNGNTQNGETGER